jgi:hypothetical protein
MSLAMSLIVDGYVRLGDRDALENLRAHRRGMLDAAMSVTGLDNSRMLAALKDEVAMIDAGLSTLSAGHAEPKPASGGDQERLPTPRDPDR